MTNNNSILLFSGGVDSYIAYYYLNKPKTIYFDIGSEYSRIEYEVTQQLIPNTIIDNSLNLSSRQLMDINAFIPMRNS